MTLQFCIIVTMFIDVFKLVLMEDDYVDHTLLYRMAIH